MPPSHFLFLMLVGLGRIVRRLQYVRYAFTQQFDEVLKESDLADIRHQVNFEDKHFDEAAADEGVMTPLNPPEKEDEND